MLDCPASSTAVGSGNERDSKSPIDARIYRINLANRLTDEARALIAVAPGDDRPYDLIVQSIRLEPSFVNAYAALADWFRSRGEDPHRGLKRVWQEHGHDNQRALRFVGQYRDSDPALRLVDWCRRSGTGPAIIVEFGDDLDFLDLYDYQGVADQPPALVGRVYDPRLVCSPRDFSELPAAKQAIAEDSVKRGKDFRVVSHRGVTVELPHRSVFGPTIDSLHFNAVLHETIYRSGLVARARRAAEIGVGSGFLLCSLVAALTHRPLQLIGSDIDPVALTVAERNIQFAVRDAPSATQIEARLEQSAHTLEQLQSHEVDLLLSNPPYIPELRYNGDNAYSGTRLIESFVTEQGPRVLAPGGVAVILFSSLALATVHRCVEESPLVPVVLAPGRRVPLDLREVGTDPEWIELLRREHHLEETLGDPSHAYWHTLCMLALCRPDDGVLLDELRSLAARKSVA